MGKAAGVPLSGVKKVMIRSANWVGDTVMSLPAIASLRLNFPRARIHILAKPWVADIFRANYDVDEVILYQNPGIHQGLAGKWRLARELKKKNFDLAFLLQNAFEAAFISVLAGIPKRAGYNTDGRSLLLTHPVLLRKEVKGGHQVDYYLAILKSLGLKLASRIPSLKIAPASQEEASRILQSLGLGESETLVGISPGATYGPAKQWFPERYAELSGRISEGLGARVLIFGSQGDKKIASRVCRNARIPLIDLTGITTLAQASALIARCKLFVTNDSGLMHVGAALGVPLVAIFGSTDHRRTGPLGEACRVIHKPVTCWPCLKTECPEETRCMDLISVDEVYEEVESLLANRQRMNNQ